MTLDTCEVNRTTQYATFFVDGLFFGIDVLKVQEVLRFQEMTPVPMAPDVITGLINLRGQIVIALDMRRRLGVGPLPEGIDPMSIVARTDDGPVSLLVDDIHDVLQVETASFEPPPDNLSTRVRQLIRGVHKLADQLLLVLETEKVVEVC